MYRNLFCTLAVTLYLLVGFPALQAQAQQYDNNAQQQYNNGQQDQQQYDNNNNNSNVTVQTFYDDLQPYGQWVEDAQYGYVFVPNVEQGFRPYYTDGHWVMTDYGNTWVSDYDWGWACFHYGRWTYDNYYGWIWIPGTEWGPSWVSWRYGTGYYGWAPLGPGYDIGVGDYYCPDDWWVFIPPQYIYSPNYYHYWGGPGENAGIIHNTTFIHNTFVNGHVTYVTGPRASEIENITHQPVTTYQLANSSNPNKSRVKGNTVKMFHPMMINQAAANGARPQNLMQAPQPISKPQSANTGTQAPAFRNEVQHSNPLFATPTNRRQNTAPSTQGRYEWNVNKSQPQQAQPRNQEPEQRPQPQQQAPRPQPQQQAPRMQQAPRPQPQMSRPAPAPHFSSPPSGGRR